MAEKTNERKIINLAGAFVFEYLHIKKLDEGDDGADELRNFFSLRTAIQGQLDRMTLEVATCIPIPEHLDVYTVTIEVLIALAARKGLRVYLHDDIVTFVDQYFTNCDVRQFPNNPPEQLLAAAEWLLSLDDVFIG